MDSLSDHHFDDAYAGFEAGPEFRLAEGRIDDRDRVCAAGTASDCWWRASAGTSIMKSCSGTNGPSAGRLLVRHNNYARRRDVDGWDAEARVSATGRSAPNTLAFAYAGVERNWAIDPGQAFWREKLGIGVLKEIGWGLRPQRGIDLARQAGGGPLAPFARERRDWLLEGTASIYKRDWTLEVSRRP